MLLNIFLTGLPRGLVLSPGRRLWVPASGALLMNTDPPALRNQIFLPKLYYRVSKLLSYYLFLGTKYSYQNCKTDFQNCYLIYLVLGTKYSYPNCTYFRFSKLLSYYLVLGTKYSNPNCKTDFQNCYLIYLVLGTKYSYPNCIADFQNCLIVESPSPSPS